MNQLKLIMTRRVHQRLTQPQCPWHLIRRKLIKPSYLQGVQPPKYPAEPPKLTGKPGFIPASTQQVVAGVNTQVQSRSVQVLENPDSCLYF